MKIKTIEQFIEAVSENPDFRYVIEKYPGDDADVVDILQIVFGDE